LFEPTNSKAYLVYHEDISKTNQGGLKHRKKSPKEVIQYANEDNVHLCRLHYSKCPFNRPDNAFYLPSREKPRQQYGIHLERLVVTFWVVFCHFYVRKPT
jgi:hypothetical protein